MGRFLYHFVRILPILALAAIYAVLLYIIANKGKWMKVASVFCYYFQTSSPAT